MAITKQEDCCDIVVTEKSIHTQAGEFLGGVWTLKTVWIIGH